MAESVYTPNREIMHSRLPRTVARATDVAIEGGYARSYSAAAAGANSGSCLGSAGFRES